MLGDQGVGVYIQGCEGGRGRVITGVNLFERIMYSISGTIFALGQDVTHNCPRAVTGVRDMVRLFL